MQSTGCSCAVQLYPHHRLLGSAHYVLDRKALRAYNVIADFRVCRVSRSGRDEHKVNLTSVMKGIGSITLKEGTNSADG